MKPFGPIFLSLGELLSNHRGPRTNCNFWQPYALSHIVEIIRLTLHRYVTLNQNSIKFHSFICFSIIKSTACEVVVSNFFSK